MRRRTSPTAPTTDTGAPAGFLATVRARLGLAPKPATYTDSDVLDMLLNGQLELRELVRDVHLRLDDIDLQLSEPAAT